MIQLRSLEFGAFAEAEPLNPYFVTGHSKMRLTVDAAGKSALAEPALLLRLLEAFPGLNTHRCQMSARRPNQERPTSGIVLLEDEPSANQAHILEHLLLEILSDLEREPRHSGVTCAYEEPLERSDIFVECGNHEAGRLGALLAVQAVNSAIAGAPLAPLYPDSVRAGAAMLRFNAGSAWFPATLASAARLPVGRAAEALRYLAACGAARPEEYALNISGELSYRLVRLGAA